MLGLLSLPTQVLQRVVAHLGPSQDDFDNFNHSYKPNGHLASLAQTCKTLLDLCIPKLYEICNLKTATRFGRRRSLFRTLASRPDIASVVQRVIVDGSFDSDCETHSYYEDEDDGGPVISAEDAAAFNQILQQKLDMSAVQPFRELQPDELKDPEECQRLGTSLACLGLAIAPNMTSAIFSSNCSSVGTFKPGSLPHLEEFSLQYSDSETGMGISMEGVQDILNATPKLRKFVGWGISGLPRSAVCPAITHVSLINSTIGDDDMASLPTLFPNLESFSYTDTDADGGSAAISGGWSASPRTISEALLCLQKTLRNVEIGAERCEIHSETGLMTSLAEMTALEALRVHARYIYGNGADSGTTLVDFLPASIQLLYMEGVQASQVENILALAREVPDRFPKLAEVVIRGSELDFLYMQVYIAFKESGVQCSRQETSINDYGCSFRDDDDDESDYEPDPDNTDVEEDYPYEYDTNSNYGTDSDNDDDDYMEYYRPEHDPSDAEFDDDENMDGIEHEFAPTVAASTPDMPSEIWAIIMRCMDSTDLYSLCLVDRQFHRLAQKQLYAHIEYICDGAEPPVGLALLTRTLHRRPDLASAAQSIALISTSSPYQVEGAEDMPSFAADFPDLVQAADNAQVPFVLDLANAAQGGTVDAIVTLLLYMVPNITQLKLTDHFAASTPLLTKLTLHAATLGSSDAPLRKLRHVEYLPFPGVPRTELDSVACPEVTPFMYLPDLQRFSAYMDHEKTEMTWPLPQEPDLSKLTHLTLIDTRERALRQIISKTNALRHLDWKYVCSGHREELSREAVIQLDELCDALLPASDSLESITLRADGDEDGTILNSSLRGLRCLEKATRFQTPARFVTGFEPGACPAPLQECMPSRVKKVCFNDDFRDWYGGRMLDADEEIVLITAWWEVKDQFTPKLEEFERRLGNQNRAWKKRHTDTLIEMGDKYGIGVRVCFERDCTE